MTIRTVSIAVAAITAALGTAAFAPAAQSAAAPAARTAAPGDFDGDGRRDLAASGSFGTVNGQAQAGLVTVVYGGPAGADAARRQVITKASPGVPGDPAGDDYFGSALASADFDRDGRADLAVAESGGATTIVYGGPRGLSARTAALPAAGGRELVTGDFDGDGKADLVAVGQDVALYRAPGAKPGAPVRSPIPLEGGENVRVGAAAGDFTGDRRTDLALVVVSEIDGEPMKSWLELRPGTAAGLGPRKVIARGGISGDGFETNLAAGDVNGDGKADLVNQRYLNDDPTPGAFSLRLGTAGGFGAARHFTQDTAGVPGKAAKGDLFGQALAVGDVDRDGKADVAVGAPGQKVGTAASAGTVTVLYGASGGLTTKRAQLFSQATKGVPGAAEKGDAFGRSLAFTDADGNGRADLLAGVPYENQPEGRLYVLPGSGTGLTVKGLKQFGPADLGVGGRSAFLGEELLR